MLADKTLFRESLRELTVIFVDSQDATVGRESGFSAGPLLDLLAAVFTCVAFGLELFASMTTSHSPRKDVAITNGVGIGRSLRLPTDAESTTTTGRSQKDRENGREEKKKLKKLNTLLLIISASWKPAGWNAYTFSDKTFHVWFPPVAKGLCYYLPVGRLFFLSRLLKRLVH